ncbi:MAG TPA: hypothetical protein VKT30_14310 [Caulobacteraceae bacterium]|nr:hypothetical protein [Caulobacteraceae bacterium]
MVVVSRYLVVLAVALGLAGCNGERPIAEAWTGGDPAKLAADKAQCHAEADKLDVSQPSTYSDPRYGVTSAMAEAVARDNPLADRGAIVRQAAYDTCMGDKGWNLAQ